MTHDQRRLYEELRDHFKRIVKITMFPELGENAGSYGIRITVAHGLWEFSKVVMWTRMGTCPIEHVINEMKALQQRALLWSD